MNIKRLVKDWVPYRVIEKRYDSSTFIDDYLKWKSLENKNIDYSNNFKTIVSVQGFGFSGSGAVIDLLREYEPCQVLGGLDDESGNVVNDEKVGEFDFLRHSGGFYDIERHLGYNNVFINDGVINRFIKMVFFSGLYRNYPESHAIFFDFLNSITDLELLNLNGRYYNPNLYLHDKKSSIFFLKDQTIDEYRKKCRNCLNALFGLFHNESKSILVADQMCCDLEFDIERDKSYFDRLKTIIIYRDPRDVYAYAVSKNVEWIAHNNVDSFITWYTNMLRKFRMTGTDALLVRFEDLLTNYGANVTRIEDYIGLSNSDHINKFRNLNPDISKKNIGIWHNSKLNSKDFEKIKSNLSTMCFDRDNGKSE